MKYITGMIAFATPCELDTAGKWNLHKHDFLDEDNMYLYESDESPFGDKHIEKGKPIDYHGDELFNVADHVRAYCDMLYQGKFAELNDLYAEVIDNVKALDMIFTLVESCLKDQKGFPIIDEFLTKEFGNIWRSFIDAKKSASDSIEEYQEKMKGMGVVFD